MKTQIPELYDIFLQHPQVVTDSRRVTPGSLFFALRGENFNGNRFAAGALEQGAAYAVVDDEQVCASSRYLLVDDVLGSLQDLARYHRNRLSIPVVGITGSNGKTTTKELISRVLAQKFNTLATTGNLNNHIGVPLSLLAVNENCGIAVIEMGANHQGEIAFLCSIAQPTHGIITNIGRAHLGGFGGYEGVIKAKSELYDHLRENGGHVFVNAGDELLMKRSEGISRTTYGEDHKAGIFGKSTESFPFVSGTIHFHQNKIKVQTQLVGGYNFINLLAAACIGNFFGVPDDAVVRAIESYVPQNNRSQLIQTQNNRVVMDAYNANPSSMELALRNFARARHAARMLILGDMLELGGESLAEHRRIVELIGELGFGEVFLVGKEFSSVAANDQQVFENREGLIGHLHTHPVQGRLILIKGSRGIGLEKVLEVL